MAGGARVVDRPAAIDCLRCAPDRVGLSPHSCLHGPVPRGAGKNAISRILLPATDSRYRTSRTSKRGFILCRHSCVGLPTQQAWLTFSARRPVPMVPTSIPSSLLICAVPYACRVCRCADACRSMVQGPAAGARAFGWVRSCLAAHRAGRARARMGNQWGVQSVPGVLRVTVHAWGI